jgi:FtsH-binding integral membrane protein
MSESDDDITRKLDDIRQLVQAESLRQGILTFAAVALSLGLVLIFVPSYIVVGGILLTVGIIGGIFGVVVSGKVLTKRIK